MTSRFAGDVVGRRYRLAAERGSGGFGRVWRAHDETLDVDIAIKELRLPPGTPETERAERLARATREARNAARLRRHDGIVAIHDVVIDDGALYHHGGTAAHHADRPYPMIMNVPGLKIMVPSNGPDLKGLLKTAIRDDNFEKATLRGRATAVARPRTAGEPHPAPHCRAPGAPPPTSAGCGSCWRTSPHGRMPSGNPVHRRSAGR